MAARWVRLDISVVKKFVLPALGMVLGVVAMAAWVRMPLGQRVGAL